MSLASSLQPGTVPRSSSRRVVPARKDFIMNMDHETGAIAITGIGYKNDVTIILEMDEMPDRYKAFFASYLLRK